MKKQFTFKKVVCIFCLIIVTSTVGACGCKADDNTTNYETEEIEDQNIVVSTENTVDKQIQVIVSKIDEWKVMDETDIWGYAITDLNKNGRLELISSECHGTGFYSTTRIFEVNDTYNSLTEYTNNFGEGDSQPDFLFLDEYKAFGSEDTFFLIVEDMIKVDAITYHYISNSISINNKTVERSVLGHRTECYQYTGDDTKMVSSFYDGDGNSINEQEYNSLVDDLYTEMGKYDVKIGWTNAVRLSEYTSEEIMKMLVDSYNVFAIISI